MKSSDFSSQKIVVMGLGRFGGGIAVSRWLAENGADVTVTDLAPAEKLADSVAQLEGLPITFHLGGHDASDLVGCDLLVVSPAVPKDRSEFVADALRRGIPLSSEMNLFIERCPATRVVGVTGSAGKSTTTAMISCIVTCAEKAGLIRKGWLGGNIGESLLNDLADIHDDDVVVLELSSFQLEDLGALRWSPSRAVICNIQQNHLDRHGTMDAYADAKLNIVRFQSDDGLVFCQQGDREVIERVTQIGAHHRIREVAFEPVFAGFLRVPGKHNCNNAAVAVAVARSLDIPDDIIRQGLNQFKGLPHRLEFVAQHDGVRYYNDSKSTTPESTRIALEAFDAPVVMMVGGGDKGMSFDSLGNSLACGAKAVVCYGQTGPQVYEAVTRYLATSASPAKVASADSFDEAVQKARTLASAGDVVVLSPACTSYDMFANYEQRGDAFREACSSFKS